jgi:non-ribosomal peptide synthetase component F
MNAPASVYLTVENNRVLLDWGHGIRGEFAALWLADNRAEDRHANGQRLIDIMDLPAEVQIESAQVDGDSLCVQFADGVPSFVRPLTWLRATLGPIRAVRSSLIVIRGWRELG